MGNKTLLVFCFVWGVLISLFLPTDNSAEGKVTAVPALTTLLSDQGGSLFARRSTAAINQLLLQESSNAHLIHLPVILRSDNLPIYFEGPLEQEPNNLTSTANGPIRLNTNYAGHSNDRNDYFSFTLPQSESIITVTLAGHAGEDSGKVQLQLRDTQEKLISFVFEKPFTIITGNLTAGLYYIRIFDESNGANDTGNLYSVRVSIP